jgi:hypothetical protein
MDAAAIFEMRKCTGNDTQDWGFDAILLTGC